MSQETALRHIAAGLFKRLPIWPPSFIMATILSQALKPLIVDGSLSPLDGRGVAIVVEDFGLKFKFCLRGSRFTPIPESAQEELSIRAVLADFYLLATRQEDPDTLFFNRRLVIEGSTELGLVAKNAMDSIEVPQPLLNLNNLLKAVEGFKVRSKKVQSMAIRKN